jgi:hypothetical protein
MIGDSCSYRASQGQGDLPQLNGFTDSFGRATHDRFSSMGWVRNCGSVMTML